MVLVPMALMSERIFSCVPRPSATTDTTEAMPIMMPSMVSRERILCAMMACTDILKASTNWSLKNSQDGFSVRLSTLLGGMLSFLLVSEMISPSLISMTRLAKAATFGSCVTKIMV